MKGTDRFDLDTLQVGFILNLNLLQYVIFTDILMY